MVIMYNNHYTIMVNSKNIHSPLTPVARDIRAICKVNKLEAIAVLAIFPALS